VPESGFFAVALEKFTKKCQEMGAPEPFRSAAASFVWSNIFDHANRPTIVCFYLELSIVPITAPGQQTDAPQPQRGSIRATVTDVDDDQCEPVRLEPKSKAAIVGVL
jgi:hypothetical protein